MEKPESPLPSELVDVGFSQDSVEQELFVKPAEIWSQLDVAQQARIIDLLSQMAYNYIAAQSEQSSQEKERESASSYPSSQDSTNTP